MDQQKENAELEKTREEHRHLEVLSKNGQYWQTIRYGMKCLGYIFCFALITFSIHSIGLHFGGKESSLQLLLSLFGNLPISIT